LCLNRQGIESVADAERLICPAGALADSEKGIRFEVEYFGEPAPAFVVRYRGRVHGYLNRCAHVAMELDWQEGVFFDSDGRDLLCSTHGAMYDTASGRCIGGPCNGTPLVKLRIEERDGMIYFKGFEDD
jgi:nitrite reductase/ring-hydroxylating ferredoxin subunit